MYIPTTPSLRRARIAVILSSVSLTLLLLRNNLISLHQFSNFIWSLSNYPGSGTMLLGIPADLFTAGVVTGAVDISVSVRLSLVEASLLICKDPSHSDSASISLVLLELILVPCSFTLYVFRFPTGNSV